MYRYLVICAALALGSVQAMAQTVGQRFTSSIQIGANSLPLPPGEWELVAQSDQVIDNRGRGSLGDARHMVLVQTQGNTVSNIVHVRTNLRGGTGGWEQVTECTRDDMLWRQSTVYTYEKDCQYVNHFVRFLQPSANQTGVMVDAAKELSARNIQSAPTAISNGVFLASRAFFLRLDVYRPSNFLAPSTHSPNWGESPWHRTRISPEMMAAVDAHRATMMSYLQQVRTAFGRW